MPFDMDEWRRRTQRWHQVPEPEQEPLKALITEMATLGFNQVQWGVDGVSVRGGKGSDLLKRIATAEKVTRVPAFFEAFGPTFIRGEGDSVLQAAHKALDIMKRQAACPHPDDAWRYTHNNGHKTCGQCGFFTDCSVEEALAHYDHGEVKIPGQDTHLKFDRRRSLCPCGQGHILSKDPVFHIYRCRACGQRLEVVVEDGTGMPVYDAEDNIVLRPIAQDPVVAGYWLPEIGKWIGKRGYPKTYTLDDLRRFQYLVASELERPGVELRIYQFDGAPGDLVPFKVDGGDLGGALKQVFEHLLNKADPTTPPE